MKTRLISPLSPDECREKISYAVIKMKGLAWETAPLFGVKYTQFNPNVVIGNLTDGGDYLLQLRGAYSSCFSPIMKTTLREFSTGTKIDCEFNYFHIGEKVPVIFTTAVFLIPPLFLFLSGVLGTIQDWPLIFVGSMICLVSLYLYRPFLRWENGEVYSEKYLVEFLEEQLNATQLYSEQ